MPSTDLERVLLVRAKARRHAKREVESLLRPSRSMTFRRSGGPEDTLAAWRVVSSRP